MKREGLQVCQMLTLISDIDFFVFFIGNLNSRCGLVRAEKLIFSLKNAFQTFLENCGVRNSEQFCILLFLDLNLYGDLLALVRELG